MSSLTQAGYGRGQRRQLVNACRSTTEAVVVPRDQSSTHTGGGRPVLAAAAAQSSQSAVTDADGSRSCVNRVTVADRDFDLSRSLYTWGNACKPQHCFENISSCRMVDNADFTDGIVALFDDTDASECLHKHEPVDTARFDIHRFVADCQAAMH